MRKSVFALVFVLLVSGGVLYLLQSPGGLSLGGIALGGKDRAFIRDASLKFMEDIKFKDFKKASTYHLAETQKARDIPELLRRVFLVKHEALDIHDFKPLFVELDSAGNRGRVKLLIQYKLLSDRAAVGSSPNADRQAEMILYWFKQPDGRWVMELESSLRS